MSARPNRSVVITGASSGIGRACALRLARRGWTVFATVRSEEDAQSLQDSGTDRLIPILLNVTDPESIWQAQQQIDASAGSGLTGLVNNAGIAIAGPVEFVPMDDFRRQFEVNVIGQVAVSQALLPLLRKGRGRIVFMSSIGGISSLPFFSPYSASKFALEAIADALRVELRPWRIPVSIIEPGSVATPIWEKSLQRAEVAFSEYPEEAHLLYGEVVARMVKLSLRAAERGVPPGEVAKSVERALTEQQPRARYLVGSETWQRILLEALPTNLRDWIISRVLGTPAESRQAERPLEKPEK